jgi:hypothetical protein
VCAARSAAAVSFVANERGLPDEPHFEAEGVYVAVLREPRARYLSQYLHVKEYGEAYLRVRAPRRRLCCACVRAAHVHPLSFVRLSVFAPRVRTQTQGEHKKWPGELRHMGVLPSEGMPSLAVMLAGAHAYLTHALQNLMRLVQAVAVLSALAARLFVVVLPRGRPPGREGRMPSGFRDSFQTRALAGASTHGLPDGGTTHAHLAAAKAHLAAFDLVLTVEELDDDVQLLAAAAGWRLRNASAARRGSRSGSEARLAALDARTRAALDAKVAHDAELYRFAQEMSARTHAAFALRSTPSGSSNRPRIADCEQLPGGEAHSPGVSPRLSPPAGGGPYGNWSHGCRHGALAALRLLRCATPPRRIHSSADGSLSCAPCADAAPVVAACAVAPRHAGAELRGWLDALRDAGIRRVYLHIDSGGDSAHEVRAKLAAAPPPELCVWHTCGAAMTPAGAVLRRRHSCARMSMPAWCCRCTRRIRRRGTAFKRLRPARPGAATARCRAAV